jgi:hypothetical protein
MTIQADPDSARVRVSASIAHAPLERRSVVTLVLTGGELQAREAAARQIIAQLGANDAIPEPASAPPKPGLSGVFSVLLAAPEEPAPSAGSAYDEPFILAPIG